jgi:hypothetical protein
MPGIFKDEENGNLVGHCEDGRERHTCREATELSERVEEPDLRQFDGEMGEENETGAAPLFSQGWDLLL